MIHPPTTLNDLIAQGFPKNTTGITSATKRDGTWHEMASATFQQKVKDFALGLYALGVRKGDRVGLHAENSTEWLISDQAILAIGAVNVPIYTTQPGDQIQYILSNAEAKVLIVSKENHFESLRPYLDQIPTVSTFIGLLEVFHPGMRSLEEVEEKGRQLSVSQPDLLVSLRAAVDPMDLASLIYTSGTTGMPKGVMLSHNNIASNVLSCLARIPFDIEGNRGEKLLSYLPLSHVFERMITYMYLHIGYPIYFTEHFHEVLEDLQYVKPVHFTTVPRLLEKFYIGIKQKVDILSGHEKFIMERAIRLAENYDVDQSMGLLERLEFGIADLMVFVNLRDLLGGRLKAITSGGAALSARVMNFMNGIGVFCGQGYGMTETSPVISVFNRSSLRAGSVGRVIKGVEVKIAEDGEILVRGPNVMQGYYKLPYETSEVLTEDGWLHTGDIGTFDDDGYLFITDRKKALFKLSTGKYVAPQPLETALACSPFIEQAVLVGNGHKFCAALVYPNRDIFKNNGLEDDVKIKARIREEINQINESFPSWEQVKKFEFLPHLLTIDDGELTPTLKVKRKVVHDKYQSLIDSMYQ